MHYSKLNELASAESTNIIDIIIEHKFGLVYSKNIMITKKNKKWGRTTFESCYYEIEQRYHKCCRLGSGSSKEFDDVIQYVNMCTRR